MEDMVSDTLPHERFTDYRDKRILITGHTGFKGAWLAEWMLLKRARVTGIALPPESPDCLFNALDHEHRLNHVVCDVRRAGPLVDAVKAAQPQVVFHLAAQALVRRAYKEPLLTWETNVSGTLNLLEAARTLSRPVTVVVVTTDKVYKNREWEFPYREVDELGGHDPYSASKAACELAVASWRSSYGSENPVSVVTARAGNVLGAGDSSEDRIVPDCFRAWKIGKKVTIRNPGATRPWQHVLEPLSGYMQLAGHVDGNGDGIQTCNFGPGAEGDRTVAELVEGLVKLDSKRGWSSGQSSGPHEARALSLAIDRARTALAWKPRLSFSETVSWTNDGYVVKSDQLPSLVVRQIADFETRL